MREIFRTKFRWQRNFIQEGRSPLTPIEQNFVDNGILSERGDSPGPPIEQNFVGNGILFARTRVILRNKRISPAQQQKFPINENFLAIERKFLTKKASICVYLQEKCLQDMFPLNSYGEVSCRFQYALLWELKSYIIRQDLFLLNPKILIPTCFPVEMACVILCQMAIGLRRAPPWPCRYRCAKPTGAPRADQVGRSPVNP